MTLQRYKRVSPQMKVMLIRLTSLRPKIGPVSEVADLLGINYENAKTICRRHKHGTLNCTKKQIAKQRSAGGRPTNQTSKETAPDSADDSNMEGYEQTVYEPYKLEPTSSVFLETVLNQPTHNFLPLKSSLSRELRPIRPIAYDSLIKDTLGLIDDT